MHNLLAPVDIEAIINQFVDIYTLTVRADDYVYREEQQQTLLKYVKGSRFDSLADIGRITTYKLLTQDCGLLALSVGMLLERRGVSVTYHCNGYHYFISVKVKASNAFIMVDNVAVDGVIRLYFDVVHNRGVFDVDKLINLSKLAQIRDIVDEGDAEWLHERLEVSFWYQQVVQTFIRCYFPDFKYPFKVAHGY